MAGGTLMSRHNYGRSPKPWSKLKSRVEALFAPGLPLAIHCNVFVKVRKEFTFDEPRCGFQCIPPTHTDFKLPIVLI